jgi:NDP-sugar pyrophosphorylase family protein
MTEKVPKILLPVAGRPFLDRQLDLLLGQGIRRVVLCLGYLGQMVVDAYGDGKSHGLQLEYSFDGPELLGTGGALREALPKLGKKFFVLYGDSFLTAHFRPIADCFERSGKPGLMTVYRNEGLYDTSNVVFIDGEIHVYDKNSRLRGMRHIDYGLSLFQASVFDQYPPRRKFDLAEVMHRLVGERQLAGFEVQDRFYEIGSRAGLAELEAMLRNRGSL